MISVPDAFRPYKQFFNWREVPRTDGKKPDKVPFNPLTGYNVDLTNSNNWLTADEALRLSEYGCGVAFVFTENDPFFFLDIDDCLINGQWSELANTMCQSFAGCYIEISHSGNGLHIFGSGAYPEHSCRYGNDLEFYTKQRFVALTGTGATGCASIIAQPSIDWLISSYFMPGIANSQITIEWTTRPCDGWDGIIDDDLLIEKMINSKSVGAAFSGKATAGDLWTGKHDGDHSVADASLCQHLSFWTGKDCERIDRLFRLSGLMRPKWDEQRGQYQYGVKTILGVIAQPQKIFGLKTVDENGMRDGFQYMTVDKQVKYFKGCAYVTNMHKIVTPKAQFLKPDQFKVVYGGYCFALDNIGEKSSVCAFNAFTQNQGYHFPKVDTTCFRPELGEFEIIHQDGLDAINTYVKIDVPRIAGDASPFLNHLAKMIPDDSDGTILLSWMAAVIQNPGKKVRWMPVIQGVQGNGKSMLMDVMQAAVGERYSHIVNAADLAKNGLTFNAWLQNRLFVGFEEIYVPKRREIMEALKPYITSKRQEIQPKGVDQFTGDNRANFMALTNHKDGVPKIKGDRRNCIFFTAQQTEDDMIAMGWKDKAGNSTRYFPDLFNWLESGGFAIVVDYLFSYRVDAQHCPFTAAVTAPMTTSTDEAIRYSLGGLEQDIEEAVSEGKVGFIFPWVSSFALSKLIDDRGDGKRIPQNKRKEIMGEMGYILHPNLKGGRINRLIPNEGGKPRLYVKRGSLQSQLKPGAVILEEYLKAQSGAVTGPAAAFQQQGV